MNKCFYYFMRVVQVLIVVTTLVSINFLFQSFEVFKKGILSSDYYIIRKSGGSTRPLRSTSIDNYEPEPQVEKLVFSKPMISSFKTKSSSSPPKVLQTAKNNSLITNDIPWKDYHTNKILETNKGGKLTKVNGVFYWIGSIPGYLLIYQSFYLGSHSWTLAKRIPHEIEKDHSPELGGCQLHQHPVYYTNHIYCKSRRWFMQYFDDDTAHNKTHSQPTDPTIGTYRMLPIPDDPSALDHFHFGGQSTYLEDTNLYFIVSRCPHHQPLERTLFIYKLNEKWTDFEKYDNRDNEIVKFKWRGRESPWLIQRKEEGLYYLFVSQTKGWKQSITYYRSSTSIKGLKGAMEKEVIMHPQNSKYIQSMGSQFRFLIKPDYDDGKTDVENESGELVLNNERERWVFGGERYPIEAPQYWDSQYGRNVMVPMTFIDDEPHVYWKEKFDWNIYDYESGDFDFQRHSRGYAPPLSPFFVSDHASSSVSVK